GSPFRSSRALVATVVPSLTEAIRAAGIFWPGATPKSCLMPATAASRYAPGWSESSLRATSCPSGRRATISVNVPPRSIQNSQRPSTWLRCSELALARDWCRGLPGARVQLAIGGRHVGRGQRGQVRRGRLLAQPHHPDVPAGAGALEQGPGEPAVAQLVDPARVADLGEDAGQHLLGGRVEHIPGLFGQQVSDSEQ